MAQPHAVWQRINKISDRELLAALRPPKASEWDTGPIERAIRMGTAGDPPAAFKALAKWHRQTLLTRATPFVERRLRHNRAASSDQLADLLNNRITVWHNLVVDFGANIDWGFLHLGKPLSGFYYFNWVQPAVHAFLANGSQEARVWLEKTVSAYRKSLATEPAASANTPAHDNVFHNCLAANGKVSNLLPAYLGLLREPTLEPAVVAAFMNVFLGVGRHLERRLTWEAGQTTACTNNISIAGAGALSILGHLFPEFRESPAWVQRANERLAFFARSSFYADGGYGERVWGYGCGALSHLVDAYVTARELGGLGDADAALRSALRRCFRWYAKTLGPDERQPTFGDAEPTPRKNPTAMNLAATVFPNAKDRFLGVDRSASYLLKPSGFAILRNGEASDSMYINLSFKKYSSWHSHWEQLSMNVWAYDTPLIQELDRWGPYHNPLDILVRAPEAHNLFLIDGMVYDPRLADAHDIQWHSDKQVDYFSACHRAYRYGTFANRTPGIFNIDGVVRRTLVFVKDPGYVLVMDSVYDENHAGFNRAVSQYWHSPFPFTMDGPGRVRTDNPDGPNCLLAYARTDGLRRLECSVDFENDEVEHGGGLKNRYTLRARRWGRVEEAGMPGFATVLFPYQRANPPRISVQPLPTAGGEPYRAEGYEIVTPAGRDIIVLNPEKRPGIICAGRRIGGVAVIRLGNDRGSHTW